MLMKKKPIIIYLFAVLVFSFSLTCLNGIKAEVIAQSSVPIVLGDPNPDNSAPRSPALVPISASYVESLSCILVNFKYDLGEVDYELVNLSTSGTESGTIDSDSGSQIIMMSGDAGYYSITFTLSSGTQYYGEFEITSI